MSADPNQPATTTPEAAPVSTESTQQPVTESTGFEGMTYVPGRLGELASDTWTKLNTPAEPVQETPAPTLEATVETPTEQPADKPVETPVEGQVEQPPAEQFAAYKTEIEQLKVANTTATTDLAAAQAKLAEFESVAPAVEVLRSQPGATELLTILQPGLAAGLTGWEDPNAPKVGTPIIEALAEFHQPLAAAIVNGVLAKYQPVFEDRVLAHYGYSKEDSPDYQRWKASGGAVSPAFSVGAFPEPTVEENTDDDGVITRTKTAMVPVLELDANGKEIEVMRKLDLETPEGARAYAYAKRDFEYRQREAERDRTEQAAKAATRAAQEQAAKEAKVQEQQSRATTWVQERGKAEVTAWESAGGPGQFSGEFEWLGKFVNAGAHLLMESDSTFQKLRQEGARAAWNGEGRAVTFAAEIDRKQAEFIKQAMEAGTKYIQELTAARAASQLGKPKLPADAPVITPNTQRITTQPVVAPVQTNGHSLPGLKPGESVADYLKRVPVEQRNPRLAATYNSR